MQLNAQKIPAISVFIVFHLAWLFIPIVLLNLVWLGQMPGDAAQKGLLISTILFLGFAMRRFNDKSDDIELHDSKVKGPSHSGWFKFHSKATELDLSDESLQIKHYSLLNISLIKNKDNCIRVVHSFYEQKALAGFIDRLKQTA